MNPAGGTGTSLKQSLAILGVASLLAVLVNAVRPDGLPWVLRPSESTNPGENPDLAKEVLIGLDDMRKHLADGSATFVDARNPEAFVQGHLALAVNVPAGRKQDYLNKVREMVPPEGMVIIYCEGGECESSNIIFEFLLKHGFRKENLRIFKPGWERLRSLEGLPIEKGDE
jgi:3-mercaptopyruvate sulfurtransferase SseA